MSKDKQDFNTKDQAHYIKYHPELKRFFGSAKAALIFQRLEYWSLKYQTGFWKFFEPCQCHPQYRPGDSWEEEIGFSRKVFNRVFSLIGTHYKSKSDFRAQQDPFQDKLYASYYDRKTNRTYFLRNHKKVKTFLNSLWKNTQQFVQKVKKISRKMGSSCNRPTGTSLARAVEDISLDISNIISLQTTTSSQQLSSFPPSPQPQQKQTERDLKKAQDMLETWNQITHSHTLITPSLKTKLALALQQSFQDSQEAWKEYCTKIASSKFLMGEAPNAHFKAWLAWVIKPETIELIEGKAYTLGDRKIPGRDIPQAGSFDATEIEGPEEWKQICKQLSDTVGYHSFKSWFSRLELREYESESPRLKCPSSFIKDRIQIQYQATLERIIKQILPHTKHLEIIL